jgi:hypothetical protein
MNNQTVWVMTRHRDYEGEDVIAVFASLESALAVRAYGWAGMKFAIFEEWHRIESDPTSNIWTARCADELGEMFIYPFKVQP